MKYKRTFAAVPTALLFTIVGGLPGMVCMTIWQFVAALAASRTNGPGIPEQMGATFILGAVSSGFGIYVTSRIFREANFRLVSTVLAALSAMIAVVTLVYEWRIAGPSLHQLDDVVARWVGFGSGGFMAAKKLGLLNFKELTENPTPDGPVASVWRERAGSALAGAAGLYGAVWTAAFLFLQAANMYHCGIFTPGAAPVSNQLLHATIWPYYVATWQLPDFATATCGRSDQVHEDAPAPPPVARMQAPAMRDAVVPTPTQAGPNDEELVAEGIKASEAGDAATAAERFRKACTDGNESGCFGLGVMELDGWPGTPADLGAASRHLAPMRTRAVAACDKGDATQCMLVGSFLEDGIAGPQELTGARRAYKAACDKLKDGIGERACMYAGCVGAVAKDDGVACGMLGMTLLSDPETKLRNAKKAVQYFDDGCKLAYASACFLAGAEYMSGEHVPKSLSLAEASFRKNCALEHKEKCPLAEAVVELARSSSPTTGEPTDVGY